MLPVTATQIKQEAYKWYLPYYAAFKVRFQDGEEGLVEGEFCFRRVPSLDHNCYVNAFVANIGWVQYSWILPNTWLFL